MLLINAALYAYDALFLSLSITCWEKEYKLTEVNIIDRWGLVIEKANPDSPTKVVELKLERIPRQRFPLFVEASDGNGNKITQETRTAIFPPPTNTQDKQTIPLPSKAIDTINDPEIRNSIGELKIFKQQQKYLKSDVEYIGSNIKEVYKRLNSMLQVLAVYSAAALVYIGYANFSWNSLGLLIITILTLTSSLLLFSKIRKLQRSRTPVISQLRGKNNDAAIIEKRLLSWGVNVDAVDHGCKCGCDDGSVLMEGKHL